MAVDTEAFVTLATNDTYGIGCLTLGSSLRRTRTSRKLVVMITSGVSQQMRNQLERVFDVVTIVDLLDSEDPQNLALLGRPDLNVTFTKLHCWCLTQFTKCVFLDADTLVLQNVDELFDRGELSAAPDAGWPDCFNSGVFVFQPSCETYQKLLELAKSLGSFDGGDQGLLNSYFSDWAHKDISRHLPFVYNVVSQAFYSYLPAFKKFKDSVKIVHFIGPVKPWNHTYNTVTRTVTPLPGSGTSEDFLQYWWNIFMEDVQGSLSPDLNPYLNIIEHYEEVYKSPCYSPKTDAVIVSPSDYPPPTDTYLILYPYVPPPLEQVYYTPSVSSSLNFTLKPANQTPSSIPSSFHGESSSSSGPTHHSATKNVDINSCNDPGAHNPQPENPIRPRDLATGASTHSIVQPQVVELQETAGRPYMQLETHYSEDPLTAITPECPSPVVYTAKEFEKMTDEQKSSSLTKEIGKTNILTESHDNVPPVNSSSCPSGESPENSQNSKENQNPAGIAGDLASIRIGGGFEGGPVIQLSDRERKLAWEKGQIDYLGRDSFANIQRKLDATINSGAAEPVIQASLTPFPRKTTSGSSTPPDTDNSSATPSSTVKTTSKSVPVVAVQAAKPKAAVQPIKVQATAKPVAAKPEPTKPALVKVQATAKPVAAKPEPTKPALVKVQATAKPVATKPEPTKPAPIKVVATAKVTPTPATAAPAAKAAPVTQAAPAPKAAPVKTSIKIAYKATPQPKPK